MKTKLNLLYAGIWIILLLCFPLYSKGQLQASIHKVLNELPSIKEDKTIQRYQMTALYLNRDLVGNFISKMRISGDYTRGLENGFVQWNNVAISASKDNSGDFPLPERQHYMDNFRYIPSSQMLDSSAFKNFPTNSESVYSKNLVWDMMALEEFAFNYLDSLKINQSYRIPTRGDFKMGNVGTYSHNEIWLCRTGVSEINGFLCAVIDFRAIDNRIELSIPGLSTIGTEQYWGTVWVALKSRSLEKGVMYSGTVQEIAFTGIREKYLMKTIRDLKVEKIQ